MDSGRRDRRTTEEMREYDSNILLKRETFPDKNEKSLIKINDFDLNRGV